MAVRLDTIETTETKRTYREKISQLICNKRLTFAHFCGIIRYREKEKTTDWNSVVLAQLVYFMLFEIKRLYGYYSTR